MRKGVKFLDDHFEETLLAIMLVLITLVEFLQVVIRNIPWIPALKWAEEFCRFCWIWSVFLSLPYTIKKASMLRAGVLLDVFPEKIRNIMNIAVDLINACAMLLLGCNSVPVISMVKQSGEKSPAMLWPMWIIYSVMLIGFFGGFIRALQQAALHISTFSEKGLSTLEQTVKAAKEEADAGKRAEGGEG